MVAVAKTAMDSKKRPATRQCAVTRRHAPAGALLRLVVAPDGQPTVDLLGKAPGRGFYVDPSALREALSPKHLRRVFRGRVKVIDTDRADVLVAETRSLLAARVTELVGLARRTGMLAVGADAAEHALRTKSGKCVVLVATDAAARTAKRFERADGSTPNVQRLRACTRERLGQALGREGVAVVATWHPKISVRLIDEIGRLTALDMCGSKGQTGNSD